MKILKQIALFVSASFAKDSDRKVPPRTPLQRINTLERFAKEWVGSQISLEVNRPNRASIMKRSVERLVEKLENAYAKPCGYFNPDIEHGGPRPKGEASERKRRWVDQELLRLQRSIDEEDDFFDRYFSSQGRKRSNNMRLSANVDRAWRQIGTGFRKWILRYISECAGQRKNSYHSNRLLKIHGSAKQAWESLSAEQAEK